MLLPTKKSVERLQVHIFLNGLHAEFEQIRGEILRGIFSWILKKHMHVFVVILFVELQCMKNLNIQSHGSLASQVSTTAKTKSKLDRTTSPLNNG